MANTFTGKRSDGAIRVPVGTATVVEVGDLLYWDATANEAKPLSSQTDNVGEERNQAEAARLFLGVSMTASPSGSTTDLLVCVDPNYEFEYTIPSATVDVGDLLGASENSGGDGLEDQQLETVGSQDLAIFAVTKYGASLTTARCKMIRSVAWAEDKKLARFQSTTTTMAGALVMTHDSTQFQFLDPGGAGRNVDLPAEEESDGLMFVIVNGADAAEDLTVRNDAAATIGTVAQNEIGIFVCNGVAWASCIGANT